MCSSLSIACLTELKTIAIMKRELRIERKTNMSYMDFMNSTLEIEKRTENARPEAKKQTKIRATSYKKEMSDFLKRIATNKFIEVLAHKGKNEDSNIMTHERIQSRKNWKKYCVKVYEADFKKECMLEVGGKFFLKPTTIPENICELTTICTKFHRRIEEELNKKVPYCAGLYKATSQRFHEMRNIKTA